jgi:hypothetical protein
MTAGRPQSSVLPTSSLRRGYELDAYADANADANVLRMTTATIAAANWPGIRGMDTFKPASARPRARVGRQTLTADRLSKLTVATVARARAGSQLDPGLKRLADGPDAIGAPVSPHRRTPSHRLDGCSNGWEVCAMVGKFALLLSAGRRCTTLRRPSAGLGIRVRRHGNQGVLNATTRA